MARTYRKTRFARKPTYKRKRTIKKAARRTFRRKSFYKKTYRKKRFSKQMFGYAYELFPGIDYPWGEILGEDSVTSMMNNWQYAKIDLQYMLKQLALSHNFDLSKIVWLKLKIWNKEVKDKPKGFLMQLGPQNLLRDLPSYLNRTPLVLEDSTFKQRIRSNGLTKTFKDYQMPLLLDPKVIFRRLFADKNASNYKGLADYSTLYVFHSTLPAKDPFDFSLTVKYKKTIGYTTGTPDYVFNATLYEEAKKREIDLKQAVENTNRDFKDNEALASSHAHQLYIDLLTSNPEADFPSISESSISKQYTDISEAKAESATKTKIIEWFKSANVMSLLDSKYVGQFFELINLMSSSNPIFQLLFTIIVEPQGKYHAGIIKNIVNFVIMHILKHHALRK